MTVETAQGSPATSTVSSVRSPSGAFTSAELDTRMRVLGATPPGSGRDTLRAETIALLLPLARRLARRYQGRGEPDDDLYQVACVGVVKAVDRYDPTKGHAFLSFAVPTVTGEIKCHFRDRTWNVRVPRRIQEAQARVRHAQRELEQSRRSADPMTTRELVTHTGLPEEDVTAALEAVGTYFASSLDAPQGRGADVPLGETLGVEERGIDLVVDCLALRNVAHRLTDRQRHILYLRFFQSMTQKQIGSVLGLSQMHVSRVLARTFDQLRRELLPPV
ncbi:SigB/SigF/SigG family RNA polymerase sigma factor [Streptomyces sp. NPDC057253]|uniref:SigB/SigF/SigG family RNA polymerase sigma factor n=1 Tax=Streptomyces sp. NPDC057253 TaxID=3346069 RepID=UPI00364533CA